MGAGKIRQDKSLTHDRMLSELKTLLRDAVRIRCDSRFTVGAHVSSGLDSSVVAACWHEWPEECVTWQERYLRAGVLGAPESNRTGDLFMMRGTWLRKLCAQHGILPRFLKLDTEGFREAVSRFYINHGFFWEEAVLRQATGEGVNLLFSGWGGDEFVSTAAPSIETDLLRGLRLRLFSGGTSCASPASS
ncbi:MAG: hypothetical protein IPI74_03470 [Bacteroidales bacterium]|nr:hypothetical protein [Bacteroidales bacterium]